MSWHTLQRRVGRLFGTQRQPSPSSSASGQLCVAAASASEPSEKVRGRLHRAATRGDLAWLRRWRWCWKLVGIDGRDEQRRTPLHLASANGHADVVRYLARKNCQLNLADDFNRTPLMEAVQCQQKECVAILLEHGADPNLADADGNTALHLAVLSANTAVAGLLLEHNASSDAQNQEGYTPLDLALSKQHEEMLECLLKEAADGHATEQCERTSLAVTTSLESDVEEDNLCLQEELERVEAELREVQKKYLQSEHILHDRMIALDNKHRGETAAVQKVQDQLLAYLETNTAVKRLEEEAHRLEIENTRLEATVQQQSNRTEALQRDLQVSASGSVPQLQQKLASAGEVKSTSKASLEVTRSHEADLEKANLYLQEELARVRAEVGELSQQLTMESKRSMQLEAQNRDLQEELSTLRGNCEKLEKSKCQLKEEVEKLQHRLEANMVDHKQMEQYKREVEERADKDIRKKLLEVNLFLQAQAASQDRLEQIRSSHHASLKDQLKERIRDLECELDKIKNTQQETTFPKECAQAEMEKYKELYLEEVKTRRCLAKKLERANERLAEANAKLVLERHKSKSLITSSIVSGGLAATPILHCSALGRLGNNSGLDRSLSEGGSFLSQHEKILSSKKEACIFCGQAGNPLKLLVSLNERVTAAKYFCALCICEVMASAVQQEQEEKITKKLKEATAELETQCAGSSRNLHVDQDPLCRAIEEYRDVLTKNYLI